MPSPPRSATPVTSTGWKAVPPGCGKRRVHGEGDSELGLVFSSEQCRLRDVECEHDLERTRF